MISSMAWLEVSPSDSDASYCPCSSRRAAKVRRPTSVCTVIVLPMTMPATGMTAIPVSGTDPVASTMATTGTTPHAIAAAAQGHVRGAPTRLEVVATAVANIAPTARNDHHNEPTTAVMTSATSDSCTTARAPAIADCRSRPMPLTRLATTVTASRMARQRYTGQPGETSHGPTLGHGPPPAADRRFLVCRVLWQTCSLRPAHDGPCHRGSRVTTPARPARPVTRRGPTDATHTFVTRWPVAPRKAKHHAHV